MQTGIKKKEPKKAGLWALFAGPFGFYFIGWRFAVAGTAVFGGAVVLAVLLFGAPLWLIIANLPVLGFVGYRTCAKLNHLAESGQARNALLSKTMPVAFFAMTSALPIVAAFSGGMMGLSTALIQLRGGHFGDTLFILGLVTPVVMAASFVVGSLVAAALDLWILRVAPTAARHIFPPVISFGG
jgi:hypothetical protein